MESSLRGAHINGFRFLRKVADGARSTVWECVYERTRGRAAAKVYEKAAMSPIQLLSVRNEIRTLQSVSHPLIVEYVCSCETEDRIFVFEEYLPNGNLKEYIEAKVSLSEAEARRFFAQLLLVIEYLQNEKRLFFRKLCVENVMLDCNCNPRLIGFGACVPLGDDDDEVRTFSDMSFGSVEYRPPEMLKNLEYTKEMDLWCLGILLFKMVTGEMPFAGDSEQQISDNIAYGEVAVPRYLSNYLRDLLQRMLSKNPLSRPNVCAIKKHVWFSITEFLIIARLNQRSEAYECEVMSTCEEYGVDMEKLKMQLEKNAFGDERVVHQMVKISKKDKYIQDIIDGKVAKKKINLEAENNNNNLLLSRQKSLPDFQIHHKSKSKSFNAFLIYEQNKNNNNTILRGNVGDEKAPQLNAANQKRKITMPKNVPISIAVRKTSILRSPKNSRSRSFCGNDVKPNFNNFPTIQ